MDCESSGSRAKYSNVTHPGTTLTDAAVRQWPTPAASLYGSSQNGVNKTRPSAGTPSLTAIARDLWPKTGGPDLKEAVRQWPTPTTQGGGCKSRSGAGKDELLLAGAAKSFRPDEIQPIQGGEAGRGHVLNPKFVNALMGIPIGWTNCASTVEGLSHYRQRMHSAFLRLTGGVPFPVRSIPSHNREGKMIKGLSRFADYMANNWGERSWTEILEPSEMLGGPSPMGSSKWQSFKDCPYLYHLMFVRRYRQAEHQEPLEIGGLFHEALARYFQGWLDGASLKEIRERAFEIVHRADPVVPDIASEVHRLLTAWMTMYHNTAYSFLDRVLAVEKLVSSSKYFQYSARLDLILEAEDGGIEIMDHKTARQRTSNMLMSYRLEPQFLGHMHLWDESGMGKKWGELTRYSVDLIVKTQQPFLDIVQVPVNRITINKWRAEMRDHWVEFNKYRRRCLPWPRRTGYQCRFCAAFEHCASDDNSLVGWVEKKEGEF